MDAMNRSMIPPTAAPMPYGATPNPNASPAAVGRQFESMFVSMLIKQMRQTVDGESMFGSDPGDIVGGMFDQFMGDHIGQADRFGIAQMIRTQLELRTSGT